jgi:hypothetical protein
MSIFIHSPRNGAAFTADELTERFGPSLASILNSKQIVRQDRFCTPSVLVGADRVQDPQASDVSISASGQPLKF